MSSKKKIKKNEKKEDKKYWIQMNTVAWAVTLVVSFFVLVPAFFALLILWAIGKIQVID